MKIFAFNTIPSQWQERIINSMKGEGVARFGWSYEKQQNLLENPYDENGTGFLLDIEDGDYIVYINLPTYGKCTLAKVIGGYFWREPMDDDFNHGLKIDTMSIIEFGRNDNIVSPQLSSRLKLQGKYWRIYCQGDFLRLLSALESEQTVVKRSIDDNINYFWEYSKNDFNKIATHLQCAHPNFSLETLMCRVFEKTGKYASVVQKHGKGDHGADIILTNIPFDCIAHESRCLVQVKSYTGRMKTEKAINDIKEAFSYYDNENEKADCALIITTATEVSQDFRICLDEVAKELKKPIGLLYGSELVKFVMRYI